MLTKLPAQWFWPLHWQQVDIRIEKWWGGGQSIKETEYNDTLLTSLTDTSHLIWNIQKVSQLCSECYECFKGFWSKVETPSVTSGVSVVSGRNRLTSWLICFYSDTTFIVMSWHPHMWCHNIHTCYVMTSTRVHRISVIILIRTACTGCYYVMT